MKLFTCNNCGQLLYFENIRCEQCGHAIGFLPEKNDLITLVSVGPGVFADTVEQQGIYKYCSNASYDACNWLLPQHSAAHFCVACKLNHTIPNLNNIEFVALWRKLEVAKHRLVYTLLQLGLPVSAKTELGDDGLAFDFLAQADSSKKVIMGHEKGLITINVAEADEAKRVQTQKDLGEPYRTLLGHFRHESGHFYWDKLIAPSGSRLKKFRDMFGDEREDYREALKRYYAEQNNNWTDRFVSAYATAHPWEDWAETWAHYLHIMDTLETAYSVGMRVRPAEALRKPKTVAQFDENPIDLDHFQALMDLWVPLTVAVNNLNRSMGQPDFYPFVISPAVVEKLDFIHQLCKEVRAEGTGEINEAERNIFQKFWA